MRSSPGGKGNRYGKPKKGKLLSFNWILRHCLQPPGSPVGSPLAVKATSPVRRHTPRFFIPSEPLTSHSSPRPPHHSHGSAFRIPMSLRPSPGSRHNISPVHTPRGISADHIRGGLPSHGQSPATHDSAFAWRAFPRQAGAHRYGSAAVKFNVDPSPSPTTSSISSLRSLSVSARSPLQEVLSEVLAASADTTGRQAPAPPSPLLPPGAIVLQSPAPKAASAAQLRPHPLANTPPAHQPGSTQKVRASGAGRGSSAFGRSSTPVKSPSLFTLPAPGSALFGLLGGKNRRTPPAVKATPPSVLINLATDNGSDTSSAGLIATPNPTELLSAAKDRAASFTRTPAAQSMRPSPFQTNVFITPNLHHMCTSTNHQAQPPTAGSAAVGVPSPDGAPRQPANPPAAGPGPAAAVGGLEPSLSQQASCGTPAAEQQQQQHAPSRESPVLSPGVSVISPVRTFFNIDAAIAAPAAPR